MDKNAIKKYAVWARNELIARVTQKAEQYEITEKKTTPAAADSINGRLLTAAEKNQRKALIEKIQADGFEQVMEEVAYTWFNRFTALRFMEVNNYLPSHTRVFTNEAGEFKPQILTDAIHLELEGLDMDKVFTLKDANKTEELYKYLLITQCNALSEILPRMFQKIADYSELLLPDYLLREGSVIEQMISMIPENNFDVNTEGGQIEIIGWLYQYYISEKHEEVVDPLHGKVVKKEEIPAATQLFTTDWVVRYLIDNSVGRYWIERNPNSTLGESLSYFVKPKDGIIKTIDEKITPQDVTTFDPCVGSGHFLIYAFDVLMKIYIEYGYSERDAAAEIVKNNLFGLDIDGRAAQLAYFSVMMKARQYDRRFFSRDIQPNIYEIMESNIADKLSIEFFHGSNTVLKKDIEALLETLKDAKEYGSILQMPAVDFEIINERFAQLTSEISIYNTYLLGDFQNLIRSAEIMSRKYAVVATNPPYLNKYDDKLKRYINTYYKAYNGDLFSVFMYRSFKYIVDGGYSGFMTPMVWMFLSSYERLRKMIIAEKSIITLIQFEYSAFSEATVPICTFVLENRTGLAAGVYFRLSDFRGGMEIQRKKIEEAISDKNCGWLYEINQNRFTAIPGYTIGYWLSNRFFSVFENGESLRNICYSFQGIITGNNVDYLRMWYEVDFNRFTDKVTSFDEHPYDVWVPYNKGGDYRKWYGNNTYILKWINDGKHLVRARTENAQYHFIPGVTWTSISSSKFSCRYFGYGFLSDSKGSSVYAQKEVSNYYICAFMNSIVVNEIFKVTNPTISYQVMNILDLPYINNDKKDAIDRYSKNSIDISKEDWDAFETSWDFKIHPLICSSHNVKEAFSKWSEECECRFRKLKSNEEELNNIFIDTYGLSDELKPDVADRDVTIRKADIQRDVRGLISYAVGCIFGRYSLDVLGLAYAGGEWDSSKYKTYKPDKDAILPICDDDYFEDDIIGRFIEFIETVYGKETLEENLRFIADALGGKGSAREVIRNYFINDFYADHLKVYQKRPIYWLFDSGKKNGFKCLIYMHRYQPDTIARIRTDYVHEQQSRYRTAIADLEQRITNASTSERVKLSKQLAKLQAQADEVRVYEEKIHHLADQMISIDLDDGVKHNYEIFKDVLAKIK